MIHGEEVYLINDNTQVLKAKFDGEAFTVHGVEVAEGEGRFFITKILHGAKKWDQFDIDTMSEGAAIMWNKKATKRTRTISSSDQDTAASTPTPLEKKKRKRQPEIWKVNRKKMAVNSGQKFQYVVKSKNGVKTHTIKEKESKPPCSDKCQLKCKEKFPEEVRKQIFTSFYATEKEPFKYNRELCWCSLG